jgi:hypothetical protein
MKPVEPTQTFETCHAPGHILIWKQRFRNVADKLNLPETISKGRIRIYNFQKK